MAANGPGEIVSLNFNSASPTITAPYLEGYDLSNTPDTFDSAAGFSVERGSIMKQVSATNYDYSAFTTLNTLMTGRTQHDLIISYIDGATQTLSDGIVTVTPVSNVVSDVQKVLIGATSANETDLDAGTGWTDLDKIIGEPTITYELAFQGSDGLGRPYYSSVRLEAEMIFPGATYGDLDSFVGTESKLALKLVDGNYQVFDNVWPFRYYKDEDGSMPRGVRLVVRAVEDNWTDILSYHDGSASSVTPGDWFAGNTITWTGFKYSESDLTTVS